MNNYRLVMICCVCLGSVGWSSAQDARKKPFMLHLDGHVITGQYSYGKVRSGTVLVPGFALLTSGDCLPGNSICFYNVVVHRKYAGIGINKAGERSLIITGADSSNYPVVVTRNGSEFQFAVDISQIPAPRKGQYQSQTWTVESPFVLSPQAVRDLGLYAGTEPMAFVIPAGQYPLYQDGNIRYWTYKIPQ